MTRIEILRVVAGMIFMAVAPGLDWPSGWFPLLLIGVVAGAIIGTWWALVLVPLSGIAAVHAWYEVREPVGPRSGYDDTTMTLILSNILICFAFVASALIGVALMRGVERAIGLSTGDRRR